jgi:hypothetical protein
MDGPGRIEATIKAESGRTAAAVATRSRMAGIGIADRPA